jgi:hypothetical protein
MVESTEQGILSPDAFRSGVATSHEGSIMTAVQETVFLQGHIIDSLILAKVLDTILMMGGTFDLQDVKIGATRDAPSQARIVVRASSGRLLPKFYGLSNRTAPRSSAKRIVVSSRHWPRECFPNSSMRRPICRPRFVSTASGWT